MGIGTRRGGTTAGHVCELRRLVHDARLRLKRRLEREGVSVEELVQVMDRR